MVVVRCIKKVSHAKRDEDEEHDIDLVSSKIKES